MEAIEFGGLRVPSVMMESLESFHRLLLRDEEKELLDKTPDLLSLAEALDDVELRLLTDSGTPSHLELTLGTL